MAEHYYTQEPTSKHEEHAFTLECAGRALRFETDAGVFSKLRLDPGTALLLKALPESFSGRALDLGCGWGPVGCCMAARWQHARIALCDVNERAAGLARENLRRNNLSGEVSCGDGLDAVEGAFDLIAVNPPIRAGKAVIYRLFAQSAQRLTAGGNLYVVMRRAQGAESAEKELKTLFSKVETVERGGGYRVFRAEK
ncbi:MAG: class I SAM-dependent methyltransferase [Clostridiales bacterium]|nr:class I SAM-dependent methyltransferase [Clostridiales bacterium]MDY2834921.1 class I SAM-dependent methyltransferase [Candidatus Aphodomonas sp.]